MSDVRLVCPVEPYELDKKMRFGMSDLADRVTASCAAHGLGKDLLLRVYMAGFYHGTELGKRHADKPTDEPVTKDREAGR